MTIRRQFSAVEKKDLKEGKNNLFFFLEIITNNWWCFKVKKSITLSVSVNIMCSFNKIGYSSLVS